jgi:hypothetical protein
MPKGKALGYCNAHYGRQRLGRDMDPPVRNSSASDSERFWSKVDKSGDCWLWTGASNRGYGAFRLDGAARLAHRVAYVWANGPVPTAAEVDHTCFNKACVNPEHLRLLSHSQNGQNRASANSNSKSGVRGVYWLEPRKGWMARAMLNRIHHPIGLFPTAEEAALAVTEWRRIHMPASIRDQRKSA